MPPTNDSTCRDVDISLLKQGDRNAFAQFVRQYQEMVFACCRAAGLCREDAEDAAAETFLAAYQSIHRFNGTCKLSSWLWTIAYRKASRIRSQKQPADLLDNEAIKEAVLSSREPAPNALETEEQSGAVWEAVRHLPEPWAAVIVLFYREDKTVAEIAEILELPINTVKTYMDRGRKKLFERLAHYWKNDYVKS